MQLGTDFRIRHTEGTQVFSTILDALEYIAKDIAYITVTVGVLWLAVELLGSNAVMVLLFGLVVLVVVRAILKNRDRP